MGFFSYSFSSVGLGNPFLKSLNFNRVVIKGSEKTDRQLVVLAKDNPDHFQGIMDRYWRRLFGYVRRVSYFSQEDIEDILQEVFLKVYRFLNDYDEKMAFSTWIYRIAHHSLIDEIRKRKSRPKHIWLEAEEWEKIFLDKLNLEQALADKISLEKARQALENLPFEYKEALVLRFWEEKSYEEMMDILRKPKGTVASLVNRGRIKLMREMEKERAV